MSSFPGAPLVSIVIRTRNCATDLRRCIRAILSQTVVQQQGCQLIVVDNQSNDETVAVAAGFGAEIVTITRDEFSWGRALNLGIRRATCDIVIIVSADVELASEGSLAALLKPFADSKVVAVYGRQVPRVDAPVDEVVRLRRTFGPDMCYVDSSSHVLPTGTGMITSNAFAAIRRQRWLNCAYDELVRGGEEGIWSYEAVRAGYAVVYQPLAVAFHSHCDSARKEAYRDWELMEKNFLLSGTRSSARHICKALLGKLRRRIVNCCGSGVTLRARVQGLVTLPTYAVAFILIAIVERWIASPGRLREWAWR